MLLGAWRSFRMWQRKRMRVSEREKAPVAYVTSRLFKPYKSLFRRIHMAFLEKQVLVVWNWPIEFCWSIKQASMEEWKKAYNRIARTDEMCLLMWQIICIYVYAERRRRRSRRWNSPECRIKHLTLHSSSSETGLSWTSLSFHLCLFHAYRFDKHEWKRGAST